jgi:hypothetical protein
MCNHDSGLTIIDFYGRPQEWEMSGGVCLTDPILWTFRRRLWNSLNCSNIWLGDLGLERSPKDGDLEALDSFGDGSG